HSAEPAARVRRHGVRPRTGRRPFLVVASNTPPARVVGPSLWRAVLRSPNLRRAILLRPGDHRPGERGARAARSRGGPDDRSALRVNGGSRSEEDEKEMEQMRIRPSLSLLVLARAVFGQSAAAPLEKMPEFEVADVQVSKSAN